MVKINQNIMDVQWIIDNDGVMADSDEDRKLSWKNDPERTLNTKITWNSNGLFLAESVLILIVLDQQSDIILSVTYQAYSSSHQQHQPKHGNSILCKAVCQIYRDKKGATLGKRNFIERVKTPIFLEAFLAMETL